jgi:hypothetical protein
MTITVFKFALDTWQHLYSLQQAIEQTDGLSGNRLSISGVIRKQAAFHNRDIPIQITFTSNDNPHYKKTADQQIIFGQLSHGDALHAEIQISAPVFRELKQNLIEYMGIEGIHILITIGLHYTESDWQQLRSSHIVQLDYAMKGEGA